MKWVKKVPLNSKGRDFVVGDLHGHIDELRKLLRIVSFDESVDRLFSVGDLADRGPKSLETMLLIYEPWFFAVRGNHEDMFCTTYGKSCVEVPCDPEYAKSMLEENGGRWHNSALSELGLTYMKDLADQIDERLPLVYIVGDDEYRFHVVHAELSGPEGELLTNKMLDDMAETGLHTYSSWDKFDEKCMWGRSIIRSRAAKNISTTISPTYSGHSIVANAPRQICHQILIDSGCYEGRSLTLVEPKTGQFWSVNKF